MLFCVKKEVVKYYKIQIEESMSPRYPQDHPQVLSNKNSSLNSTKQGSTDSQPEQFPPPTYEQSLKKQKTSLTELVQSSIHAFKAPEVANDCAMKRNTIHFSALELTTGTLGLSQRPAGTTIKSIM